MRLARLVDPADPRAPSQETWDALTPEERAEVLELLPSEEEGFLPPEGDPHNDAAASTKSALRGFYARTGRKAYVASNMNVFYPEERRFAPDCIVILDAEPHSRERWVVSAEGNGLDFALEITWGGDHKKDAVRNVAWFARLGIPEYFVFDLKRQHLAGHRLVGDAREYVPIIPQGGRFGSEVLGMDLAIEDGNVRFYFGTARLLDAEEMKEKLERALDGATACAQQEAARAEQEAARAEQEAARAEQEAARAEQEATRALSSARARVLDIAELLELDLDAARRAELDRLDADALGALAETLKRERRWPAF